MILQKFSLRLTIHSHFFEHFTPDSKEYSIPEFLVLYFCKIQAYLCVCCTITSFTTIHVLQILKIMKILPL